MKKMYLFLVLFALMAGDGFTWGEGVPAGEPGVSGAASAGEGYVAEPPYKAPEPPVAKDGCVVGGCSGELCVDGKDGPVASPCLWTASFACYGKTSVCERGADGRCGWRQTTELKACLEKAKDFQMPRVE